MKNKTVLIIIIIAIIIICCSCNKVVEPSNTSMEDVKKDYSINLVNEDTIELLNDKNEVIATFGTLDSLVYYIEQDNL